MSTMTRLTSTAPVPGRLLGARQLADVVRRQAASPAEWMTRVRLNPEGRWYERIPLDDSHEVWVISWLPGQSTGFHNHGGAAGAFTVVWGALGGGRGGGGGAPRQGLAKPVGPGGGSGVGGGAPTGRVRAKPIGAGGARSFGPRYIHDVRNAATSTVAVSV